MVGGPKSHAPEGWYHVVCRGNGGKAVFGRDEDRRRFLGLVAEVQAVGDMEYAAAAQGVRRF
jgi:hypothetical protein